MSQAAVNHVLNYKGLSDYKHYKFNFVLSDSTVVGFECVATQSSEAWLIAANSASRYNLPCREIKLVGREE
jgi:hypothetical protein